MTLITTTNLSWITHTRNTLAALILACSSSWLPATAATRGDDLPVANFTGYNDIPEVVRERLSEDIKSLVREKKLTVFVRAEAYAGLKACFVMTGLSYEAAQGLNPRVPSLSEISHSVSSADDWTPAKCVGERLESTIERLNNAPKEKLLKRLEPTADGGRRAESEPTDRGRVFLSALGLSEGAKKAVLDVLLAHGVQKAVDYRQVETAIYASAITFNGGDIMCVVDAGMVARSPHDRNFRWPSAVVSRARVQTGGTPENCIELVASDTVKEMLKQPWSDKGLFKDFHRSREAGVALPNIKSVETKRASFLKKSAAAEHSSKVAAMQSSAHNVLTCKNQCANGSCLRTFPDGRKERWQAPRVFNPVTQNWDWDITTNACGG